MKFYLIGGAVRDRLLELPVRDRDWVVVGGTEAEMLGMGFVRATADFPVFIHPETGEEYALARCETKVAPGYRGFVVEAGPQVTLEQDLIRRDLTINALAEDESGELIDLFDGRRDLHDGILRHISPAFVEDPVRLLRVARFAARLGRWGFRVNHTTHGLMKGMVRSGELSALHEERVWREMKQALAEDQPWRFFEVLQRTGALEVLIPELNRLMIGGASHSDGVDSSAIASLKRAVEMGSNPRVRFAVLMYDAADGAADLAGLLYHMRAEREYSDLLELLVGQAGSYRGLAADNPEGLLALIERTRALRQPGRWDDFLSACGALWPQLGAGNRALVEGALIAVQSVTASSLAQSGLTGSELGRELRRERLKAVSRRGSPPHE